MIQGLSEIPWQSRLFDSLIVFQNYRVDVALGKLGRHARLFPVQAPEATNYPLTIAISPGEQLRLRLIYNENRLGRDTIEAIAEDLPAMLSALGASRPASTISDILDQMPAERRGKAAATAAAAQSARLPVVSRIAPKGETERRLVDIWSELLGKSDVGVDDNFFDVGGQSLLLLRMHQLIENAFGVRVPIVKLLQYPTIRALATQLGSPSRQNLPARHSELAAERALKQRTALARQRVKPNVG